MRISTKKVCKAFIQGEQLRMGNGKTNGAALYLFGNCIAWRTPEGRIALSDAGFRTVTTKRWLNGLLDTIGGPFILYQKKRQWYIWNGCNRIEWEGTYLI